MKDNYTKWLPHIICTSHIYISTDSEIGRTKIQSDKSYLWIDQFCTLCSCIAKIYKFSQDCDSDHTLKIQLIYITK